MTFAEVDEALRGLQDIAAERYPARVNLTANDMADLLSRYSFNPGPNECGVWPLASLRGLPVYYGERSEIVYSDGTTEPLYETMYNSP